MEGTRIDIIQDIIAHLTAPSDPSQRIMMLSGSAGTGKSTIAKTVALILAEETHILAASFFFSRNYAERRQIKGLPLTLAFQLADYNADFKNILVKFLDEDHTGILDADPQVQFQKLVVGLLAQIPTSEKLWVICLDALDECGQDRGQMFLRWLSDSITEIPGHVRFFLTGRPDVPSYLKHDILCSSMHGITLDDIGKETVGMDIRRYVEQSLDGSTWTPRYTWTAQMHDIDEITRRADGLFVFAATAIRYICAGSARVNPQKALNYILQGVGLADLYELYFHIVNEAIPMPSETDPLDQELYILSMNILSTILELFQPLDHKGLAVLLNSDEDSVRRALTSLSAVIHVPETGVVQILHPSFREFMTSPESKLYKHRPDLLCGTEKQKQEFASRVLQTMQGKISQGIFYEDYLFFSVKDINGQHPDAQVLLPTKDCSSWQKFCNSLEEQNFPALSFIEGQQFVLCLEDSQQPKPLLFGKEWDKWISSLRYKPKVLHHVTLRIIQEYCCGQLIENQDQFCGNCKMPFLLVENLEQETGDQEEDRHAPEVDMEMAHMEVYSEKERSDQIPTTSISEFPMVLIAETTTPISDMAVVPIPPPMLAQSGSFAPSAQNSVLRRRRPPPKEGTQGHHYPPMGPAHSQPLEPDLGDTGESVPVPLRHWQLWQVSKSAKQLVKSIFNYRHVVHVFIIAPPFILNRGVPWDPVRLNNRLNALQGPGLAVNTFLAGVPWAILALSPISSSSGARSLMTLSGIFAIFGVFYAVFLNHQIGDSKIQFESWFLDHMDVLDPNESQSWTLSTMISLPVTWLAWAALHLLFSGLWFGFEIFAFNMKNPVIQNIDVNSIANVTGNPGSNPTVSTKTATDLSMMESTVFLVVVLWSCSYFVMIQREVQKCRMSMQRSRNPRRQDTGLLEEGQDESG
ncbi:hypothetical protein C8J57DRAFT_1717881 [Mycena rebaudengoi]|nr:hypothetical protein C8J57DRAFT_1717881 [Mycena rebaudengoi]